MSRRNVESWKCRKLSHRLLPNRDGFEIQRLRGSCGPGGGLSVDAPRESRHSERSSFSSGNEQALGVSRRSVLRGVSLSVHKHKHTCTYQVIYTLDCGPLVFTSDSLGQYADVWVHRCVHSWRTHTCTRRGSSSFHSRRIADKAFLFAASLRYSFSHSLRLF